jgi:ketosteroid isomerase-like protein
MSSMDDEEEIHSLFERGDRALMTADIATLQQIFADDYVQYDPSGKASSRQAVIDALRSGTVQYPAIISTGRRIRLFGDMAIVHGSESDEVETAGARFAVRYLYMDVVLKRGGRWQIVGSQLAKPEAER